MTHEWEGLVGGSSTTIYLLWRGYSRRDRQDIARTSYYPLESTIQKPATNRIEIEHIQFCSEKSPLYVHNTSVGTFPRNFPVDEGVKYQMPKFSKKNGVLLLC
jgi:hypothetical protein